MPQFEYNSVQIEIEIPDLVISDTIIKRKILLDSMTYNQAAKIVVLDWIVKHYSNNSDKYGEYLGDGIAYRRIEDKRRTTTADNSVFVDVQTGEFITEEQKNSVMWIGQYDFFNMLSEVMPIKIHETIHNYGSKIDWTI